MKEEKKQLQFCLQNINVCIYYGTFFFILETYKPKVRLISESLHSI